MFTLGKFLKLVFLEFVSKDAFHWIIIFDFIVDGWFVNLAEYVGVEFVNVLFGVGVQLYFVISWLR